MDAHGVFQELINRQNGKRGLDGNWSIRCPVHDDHDNSACVKIDGDSLLIKCFVCDQEHLVSEMKRQRLWPEAKERRTEYFYHNLSGEIVHKKVRIEGEGRKKTFKQHHLEGKAWVDSAYPGELLPYDFTNWENKEGIVFFVEGEKCAEALKAHGLIGTTTGGSSDWRPCYARHFKGRSVIIIPDNDAPGKEYASKAYDAIRSAAKDCHILQLPDLKEKDDIYDWFRAGHSPDELLALVKSQRSKTLIEFVTFKDLRPTDSGGSLIEGLLDLENQSCVYGESNVGKSFLALDMALHIAQGAEWFGRKTKKGAVMYIAAEAGPSVAKRTEAFKRHHLVEADLPFGAILASVDMFDKAADTSRIIEAIRALERQFDQKCELVVIDTLAKAIAGANENAAQDMNAFLHNVDRIRFQVKAHVMIVHHSGKDVARGARGHSSLRAGVDTEIHVFDNALKIKKQRNMSIESKPMGFNLKEIELGLGESGKMMTSCVVEPRDYINNTERKIKSDDRSLQALECLREAIRISGGNKVSTKQWKELYLTRHMLEVESRTTKDSAFRKAAELLQAKKIVIVSGQDCWVNEANYKERH